MEPDNVGNQSSMILPDFFLESRANFKLKYTGIDHPDHCIDKTYFNNYSHEIEYQYNSRGFRDAEWPNTTDELKKAAWCVGDSFTVGVGSPEQHMWTRVFSNQLNKRTINVSLDGASNKWIARKAHRILDVIQPKLLILQWTYITRDELDDVSLSDEDRRLYYKADNLRKYDNDDYLTGLKILIDNIEQCKNTTQVIHSFIPGFGMDFNALTIWEDVRGPDWPSCPDSFNSFKSLPDTIKKELQQFNLYQCYWNYFNFFNGLDFVPEIKKLDVARDGHHYDLLTAETLVGSIRQRLSDGII